MKALLKRDFSENSKSIYVNRNIEESGIHFSVFSTGYEEIGKKYYLRRSNFFCHMLTFIVEGGGILSYRGKKYQFHKGNMIFISGMDEHAITPDENGMTIYYSHIQNASLQTFSEFLYKQNGPIITFNDIGFEQICGKMKRIFDLANSGITDVLLYSPIVYDILLDVSRNISLEEGPLNAPSVLNDAKRFISENYANRIGLEDIANHVNTSKFHLEKIFRTYLKESVCHYLSHTRLKKSQNLLIQTNYSIEEIALMVGLSDSQSLIRLYKRFFNDTPFQYRKRVNVI